MKTVAALYIDPCGPYPRMEGIDCWDAERDARLYAGPCPSRSPRGQSASRALFSAILTVDTRRVPCQGRTMKRFAADGIWGPSQSSGRLDEGFHSAADPNRCQGRTMKRFATPHRRNIVLAAATGLSTNTIRRYYDGGDMRESHAAAIERACVELDIEPRVRASAEPSASGAKGAASA